MNSTTNTTGEASNANANAAAAPTVETPKERLFCYLPAAQISSPQQILAVAATRRCKRLVVVLPRHIVNVWADVLYQHTEPCISISTTVSDSSTLVPSSSTDPLKVAPRAPTALHGPFAAAKDGPPGRSAQGAPTGAPTGPRAFVGSLPNRTPAPTHTRPTRRLVAQRPTRTIGLYVHTGNGYHGHPCAVGPEQLLSFDTNIVLATWPSLHQEYAHCRRGDAQALRKSRLFAHDWGFVLLVGSQMASADQLEAAMGLSTAAGGMRVISLPFDGKWHSGMGKRELETYMPRAEATTAETETTDEKEVKAVEDKEKKEREERVKAQVDHQMRLAEEAKQARAGVGMAGGWVEEWVGVLCAAEPEAGGASTPSLLDGHDEEMHLEMHSVMQPSEVEEAELGDLIQL